MDSKQKKLLENKIYKMLKEGMFEDLMPEKSSYNNNKSNPSDDRETAHASKSVEKEIITWLTDKQVDMAAIAAKLWPEKDEDTRRSEFSKKVRGEDNDGKPYHFDKDDMTKLWNIKNTFIDKVNENTITTSKLVEMIKESIENNLVLGKR